MYPNAPHKEATFYMQCPEMGTMKVKVPVNPESSGFYIWGMAQQALENIKKTKNFDQL